MKLTLSILLSVMFLFSCNSSNQEENSSATSGKVISIIDGDTYDILIDENKKNKLVYVIKIEIFQTK